jgi:hypothetical protein
MRKLRTRQHIIEDLGFNAVEKQILKAGFLMLRQTMGDYGLDGDIQTFNEEGEIEMEKIPFQLKSTDHIKWSDDASEIKFDLSKRDLELWLLSDKTVLLFLFDAKTDKTYFLDLQTYFLDNRIVLRDINKYIRVVIPKKNRLNARVVRLFRIKIQQSI